MVDNTVKTPEKSAFQEMAEDLAKIREALTRLEKSGISMELMNIYIQKKTGLALFKIKAVLEAQKGFLREAVKL